MNQNYTPIVLQILDKTGTLLATGVCEYDEVDGISSRLEELCTTRNLHMKRTVPHTLASLLHWLER